MKQEQMKIWERFLKGLLVMTVAHKETLQNL